MLDRLRRRVQLSPKAYRRITVAALVALVFIIVTGAAVRLTGSGLGCSDWPTCEQDQFVAPLEYHALVEFVNRTITGLVSIAVMLAVLGALVRQPMRRDLTRWSLGLVAGVLAQIVLGGIVVKLELAPVAVIGHFLVSIALVWNAVVLVDKAGHASGSGTRTVSPATRSLGRGLVGVTLLTIVAGTVVTATGPHGGDEDAVRLDLDISEVVRVHGVLAWVLLALAVATLAVAHRQGATGELRRRGGLLVGAIVAQGTIGYVQYFNGIPAQLVALHVLGSVLVWVAVLWFYLGMFAHPAESDDTMVLSSPVAARGA